MRFYSEEWRLGTDDLVSLPFNKSTFSYIQEAINRIFAISNEMDYITLMDSNFQDFNCDVRSIMADGRADLKRINCSFSNFFSSFYLWKEYHKHTYRGLFENMLICCRKRNVVFSLGEEMRHYVAHTAFAITKVEYDAIKKIRRYPINPQIIINRAKNSNHSLNAPLRKWLEKKEKNGESVEADWLVLEFYQMCTDIQKEFWDSCIEQIHKDLETIYDLLPNEFSNIYNISVRSEDQTIHLGVGQIIALFLKKAAWQYPKFIPDKYVGKF